eukprot:764208-Hanusia_phi.AAC.2
MQQQRQRMFLPRLRNSSGLEQTIQERSEPAAAAAAAAASIDVFAWSSVTSDGSFFNMSASCFTQRCQDLGQDWSYLDLWILVCSNGQAS